MRKIKAILIIFILGYLACMYHDEIIEFIHHLPFVKISCEYESSDENRGGYEYYFRPYTENG